MVDKPRVLVLGGCGFIGRHVVSYIYDNKLASHITVADKVLYQIAGLSEKEKAIFEDKSIVTINKPILLVKRILLRCLMVLNILM